MNSAQAGPSAAALLAVAAVNLAIGLACIGLSLVLEDVGGTMAGPASSVFLFAAYVIWRAALSRLAPGKYGWVGHPLFVAAAFAMIAGAGAIAFVYGIGDKGTPGLVMGLAGVILGVVGFYGFVSTVVLSAGSFIVGAIPPRWRFATGCGVAIACIALGFLVRGADVLSVLAVLCGALIVAIIGNLVWRAVMAVNEASVNALSRDSAENPADAARGGKNP